jgi:aspartyl-tRNA(Asn)/glutamyl-tRNA(Gln) amidotransferase subunit B
MEYESIIGLEIHAQILTDSKIFCGCSTAFGSPPNSQVCPVCLGMPGVLPVLNKKVVEYAIRMVLAVGGKVNPKSIFARKNYFYPDLPKGYQISQYESPLAEGGSVEIEIDGQIKKIGITRIHLEEDAGKSLHSEGNENYSLIDMNRCGVPLIEIVSEPDMRSPKEAYQYLLKLKQVLQYLEICSGDMEKGSLRCDANVSIRPKGQEKFGVKTEVKNLNSFKAVEKALSYEIQRQIELKELGGKVVQETFLWDEQNEVTISMRGKEESHDYRYFPEPDLVTLFISPNWIEEIRSSLPELPEQKKARFVKEYNIPEYDAGVLTSTKELAKYFEEGAVKFSDRKLLANWVMGPVLQELREKKAGIEDFKIPPLMLVNLLGEITNRTITGTIAKQIFVEMIETGKNAKTIIEEKGLKQVSDSGELEKIIEEVLKENPENVKKYLGGKEGIFGFFVGEVMKKTKGKANPKMVNEILKEKFAKP